MTSTVFLISESKVVCYWLQCGNSAIKHHNINTCVHAEGFMQLRLSEKINKYLSKATTVMEK